MKTAPRLAPADLKALLDGDWKTKGPLRLNEHLDAHDLRSSLIYVNARRTVETVLEAGVAPATAQGRFAPDFAKSLVARLWWGSSGDLGPPQWYEPGDAQYARVLGLTQRALETSGLIQRAPGGLVATALAEQLLAPGRAGELFARLFRAYFRDMDHSDLDFEPAIPRAWRYVPHLLWVLGRVDDWHRAETLVRLSVPPDVLAAENRRLAKLARRLHACPTVEVLYLVRALELLQDFVVVEGRAAHLGEPYGYETRFRRGRLYDRVLRFEFETGPTRPGRGRGRGSASAR